MSADAATAVAVLATGVMGAPLAALLELEVLDDVS
jgi:hypothetical protein